MFQRLTKNKVPIVILVLCVLSLVLFFNKEPLRTSEARNTEAQAPLKTSVRNVASSVKKNTDKASGLNYPGSIESEEKFSFKKEAQRIVKLSKDLPNEKATLIEIILKKDIYKDGIKKVRAHTANEIYQNQRGALKVLALKALMASDLDNESIKGELSYIIQNAQDPTIVKIASAARDSVDKGRSFFDDFPKAIGSMSH